MKDKQADKKQALGTAEDLKKEMANKILQLAEDFGDSEEDLVEFVQFSERFSYRYSVRNTMLIYSQNRGAMLCNSFAAWKKLGCSVKKGHHGMKILVQVKATFLKIGDQEIPLINATEEQKEMYRLGKLESRESIHYRVGTTFDIADTTFPLEKYLQLLTRGHDSQKHQNYLSALSCYAAEKLHTNSFWGAEEKEIHGVGIRGFYRRDEIHVMSNLKATEALSTYMHELGHNLMHHEQKEKTSAQREFEADVFCVLLATHLGIEVEKSRKSHLHACYKNLQAQEGVSVTQVMEQVYQVYRSALKEIDFYLKQEKNLRVQKSSEKLMKL